MDERFMERAIELARKGEGYTSPNPLVGAVIVKENRIIGEGYHEYFGGSHAEVNALKNAMESVNGATMYVTLEPCSHYGKTPPCANEIVKKGISRVIIGMKDPNPLVAGKGMNILEENGIEVELGVLEKEVKKLNEIFIKYITTKKPFCILKTAMTLDGKIATYTGDSRWITNEYSRQHVHELRHRVSSIMVGIGTVLADDPMLTTRLLERKGRDPIRIIIDTKGRIPLEAKALNLKSKAKTIIAVTEKVKKSKLIALKEKGAEVIITPLKNEKVDLKFLMEKIAAMGIDSILIEGGAGLNFSVLNEDIIDKVITFVAPKIIGGENAKTPVGGDGLALMQGAISLKDIRVKRFNDDIMIEGYIRREE